jgi:hypothetical protein
MSGKSKRPRLYMGLIYSYLLLNQLTMNGLLAP